MGGREGNRDGSDEKADGEWGWETGTRLPAGRLVPMTAVTGGGTAWSLVVLDGRAPVRVSAPFATAGEGTLFAREELVGARWGAVPFMGLGRIALL
ncbi:hypothetical protein AB1484_27040 [Parafrankia sp. FMc6]|uniref:hypothetical protein n=1 Tax=Parafrankia soli TaxID=2599596 RepID=UPI0034D5663B